MANQQDRIDTIVALINCNTAISPTKFNKLRIELKQVIEVDIINPPKRRNILKILHSTRALDSTLKAILDYYRIRNGNHSLGQYITQLANHRSPALGNISRSERDKYQRSIANVRNTHLHEADSYPKNDKEVNQLISEMQALLTRVSSL
jgi:hypothetical protein